MCLRQCLFACAPVCTVHVMLVVCANTSFERMNVFMRYVLSDCILSHWPITFLNLSFTFLFIAFFQSMLDFYFVHSVRTSSLSSFIRCVYCLFIQCMVTFSSTNHSHGFECLWPFAATVFVAVHAALDTANELIRNLLNSNSACRKKMLQWELNRFLYISSIDDFERYF